MRSEGEGRGHNDDDELKGEEEGECRSPEMVWMYQSQVKI